jgi:RNA polymerase sigma-70 factor (ECF subfamily)
MIQLQREVALNRDKRAYEELFILFYKRMTRFAITIVRSREAAEEVYSNVLLKLWDMGPALGTVDNLTVYLFISVRNESLNYLSKYYKYETVDIESIEATPGVYTPEESMLLSELHRTIHRSVHSLPVKCQLVYRLIKEEGMSYKEVAEILHLSVNTIEGHMTTALRKLSVSLRPYLYPDKH